MTDLSNIKLPDSIITLDRYAENGCLIIDGKTIENVDGVRRIVVESRPGADSYIITEVWLPKNWNGIFIGLGNGGMAGKINHWTLSQHARCGYAAAHTDMGTSRGAESGISNPDVWRDFGWRATHLMTVIGKMLATEYYGKSPEYSYFIGRSTGGQQALSEAQRYPGDYDGIIAGVPGNSRTALHTYFLWNYTHMVDREFGPLFTKEQLEALTAFGVEFFQGRGDGEKGDNFITNPYFGENTTKEFVDFLRSKSRFSYRQLDALKALYDGPKDPKTGRQIHSGVPIGSERFAVNMLGIGVKEMPYVYPFEWVFGKDFDKYSFDYSDDFIKVRETLSDDMDALSTELSEFSENGGKLIAYSGTADLIVPYSDFVKYYNRVCGAFGDVSKVQSFFKWYLLPGKNHNVNGNGVNVWWGDENGESLLETLRKWREQGKEPQYIVGARVEHHDGKAVTVFKRKCTQYNGDWLDGKDFPLPLDESYI